MKNSAMRPMRDHTWRRVYGDTGFYFRCTRCPRVVHTLNTCANCGGPANRHSDDGHCGMSPYSFRYYFLEEGCVHD